MNESQLRALIIKDQTEREMAIRTNKVLLEGISDKLLQITHDLDKSLEIGVDLTEIVKMDLEKICSDPDYIATILAMLEEKSMQLLNFVEAELVK